MKLKRIVLIAAGLVAVVCLFYFFASFTPLEPRLHLTPVWNIDITKMPDEADGETLLPFRLGKNIGYFTRSGKITLLERVQYKATISKDFFALYPSNAENVEVFNSSGESRCVIKGAGFPYIKDDRIFLFLPGGSAFAAIDNESGEVKKIDGTGAAARYEHSSPITSFGSEANGYAAGFANGDFFVFDNDGKLKWDNDYADDSNHLVVLGGAISKSGKYFACVRGHEPQRFVLYHYEENHAQIIFNENLKKAISRQAFVHFSADEKFVYFDSGDGLGIVDTKNRVSKYVPIVGAVTDIQDLPRGIVFVMSKSENNYRVTIIDNYDKESGSFGFEAETSFILADDDALFVGRDNTISMIAISKE